MQLIWIPDDKGMTVKKTKNSYFVIIF